MEINDTLGLFFTLYIMQILLVCADLIGGYPYFLFENSKKSFIFALTPLFLFYGVYKLVKKFIKEFSELGQ